MIWYGEVMRGVGGFFGKLWRFGQRRMLLSLLWMKGVVFELCSGARRERIDTVMTFLWLLLFCLENWIVVLVPGKVRYIYRFKCLSGI